MKAEKQAPTWVLWLLAHPFLTLIVGAILLNVPIIAFALYFDNRVDDRLSAAAQLPPTHYAPPKSNVASSERVLLGGARAGQVVYSPVYSHVYYQQGRPFLMEATLSIRNTDLDSAITINKVEYYDTKGKRVREHLQAPLRLPPLASTEFLVEMRDAQGGAGANFIVEWVADEAVTDPLIETVMAGSSGDHAICFARPSTVLVDKRQ